jgi:glutathione S-transferase
MAGDGKPILWHLEISHYNEKVRWALDYKGIEHERREPMPGAHMLFALARTRGRSVTLPMLKLDGETICDSTKIIAALERRYPEPALYPEDPEERRRALELEDWFDEELAPYTRRLAFHEAMRNPETVEDFNQRFVPAPLRRFSKPVMTRFAGIRYGAKSVEAAEESRARVLAGLDRLEAELEGRDYLVSDGFTVADLTAASVLYPVVVPREGPRLPPLPDAYERFRAPLLERPGCRWVAEMFRRHRVGVPVPAPPQPLSVS